MAENTEAIETALSQWAGQSERVDSSNYGLQALSGDASRRRYFQLINHPDLLAVYAPPTTDDPQIFVDIAHYLREQGIHAPRVFEFDSERGFLLIENFGDDLYLSALNADNVETLYGEALLTLLRMQQSPADSKLLGQYDADKLRAEMELFPHWFVQRLLGYTLADTEREMLDNLFTSLIGSALEQPQVFVHRDFHSRNLIHRKVGPPGVIDFQDAQWGPVTYDLVSLLKDCYIRWPRHLVQRWAAAYGSMIGSAGIIKPVATEQFLRWFDFMGLQRHLKVLGIFARLFLRDNKSNYLKDLPLVMRYTLEVADQYPEFDQFSQWFKTILLPACEQQSWYEDYQTAGYSPMIEAEK